VPRESNARPGADTEHFYPKNEITCNNLRVSQLSLIFRKPEAVLQKRLPSGGHAARAWHEHPQPAPGELDAHCQRPVLPLQLPEMCLNIPTLVQKIVLSEQPFRVERLDSPQLSYCVSGAQRIANVGQKGESNLESNGKKWHRLLSTCAST